MSGPLGFCYPIHRQGETSGVEEKKTKITFLKKDNHMLKFSNFGFVFREV